MKAFKLHDPVIWIDEQSGYFTGIITGVSKGGFTIAWDCPSPYDEEKNEVFYPDEYLNIKTASDKPVIRLDISRIRETKIDNILQ